MRTGTSPAAVGRGIFDRRDRGARLEGRQVLVVGGAHGRGIGPVPSVGGRKRREELAISGCTGMIVQTLVVEAISPGFWPGNTESTSSSDQPWRDRRCSSSVTGLRVAWYCASASADGIRLGEDVGERAGVEDRRVRALALVVAHRVRRIADEGDAVGVPDVDRVDVVDRADVHDAHVEVAGRGDDPLVEACDGLEEVLLGDLGGRGAVGIERRDVERDLVAVQQRQE